MTHPFLQPGQQPNTLSRIAQGLSGFGAGVKGQGLAFQQLQQNQQTALSNKRQQAAAADLRRVRSLLDAGDLNSVRSLAQERVGLIQQLGGDPRETQNLLNLTEASLAGDPNALNSLNAEVNAGLQSAADAGFIDLPAPTRPQGPLSAAGKLQSDIDRGILTPEQAQSPQNKSVQSSKILPGGVTQITFKDGSTVVREVSEEELKIVKDAERRGVTLAQASSAARVTGKGEAGRTQNSIDLGVESVQAIPILRRGLQLLERVETGGFDAAKLRARQLFGIEGADEGELSANLGRAVLGQLRETFGAAFTENEGARLERLSAGFGKSLASNKRLLRQALVLIQGSADRGLKAAGRVEDQAAIEQILDFQEGRFDLTDEALANVFNPRGATSPGTVNNQGQRIINFDAQGNRIDG